VEGGTLPGLENLSDFEVVYDPAKLAQAILDGNYLPSNVFGGERTAPDYDVRERVFAALDLPDSLGTAGSPDAEYRNEHTRSDLYNAAQALGHDVEWASATKTEMAELLAQESPGDVRAALSDE